MLGIACIFVSCTLFIHLGLGDAVRKVTRFDFVLFRCVKCLTFWSVLGYSIYVKLPVVHSVCIAFICSYLSLWMELLLGKLAEMYEKLSESMDAEESEADRSIRNEEDKTRKGQESVLP